MSYYQQPRSGMPLQADPVNVMYPPLNIDINRPPYVPPIQAPIPELNSYIPYISGRLILEIQSQAGTNPLRTYMFNMAYGNPAAPYANEYFDAIIGTAVEMAAWLIQTQNQPVNQAVDIAITDVVNMTCAVNTREYPELLQYIQDQRVQQAIFTTIGEFDALGRSIGLWKQQSQSRYGNQPQRTGTYQPPQQRQSAYSGGQPQQSKFSSAIAPAVQVETNQRSKWGNSTTQPVNEVNPMHANQPQQVTPVQVFTLPATIGNWKPSKTMPYFLAYNPDEINALLVDDGSGELIPNYKPKAEHEMDYDKHSTPNAFGKVPVFLDLTDAARTMENIRKGITKVNKESQLPLVDADQKPIIKTTISPIWLLEASEAMAWLTSQVMMLGLDVSSGSPDVYRSYGIIIDPVITMEDESRFIAELGKSKTFIGLREKMENLGGEMSVALVNAINMRMTKMINRKINLELGLKTPTITNFRDDIGDITEALSKKHGTLMRNAFLHNQAIDIAHTLRAVTRENAVKFSDDMFDGMTFPGDKRPSITCISSNYSLTYIDCLSWEINIELGEDEVPARVTKELTPVFYDLVKGIFDDSMNYLDEGSTESSIGRFLVRTRDGRVLEATRGALDENAYLITLVG